MLLSEYFSTFFLLIANAHKVTATIAAATEISAGLLNSGTVGLLEVLEVGVEFMKPLELDGS